ncbi:MAG: hypothetical protein ACTSU9_05680, partial [Promethearchaeota archaeon]
LCGVYNSMLVPSQVYSQIPGTPAILVNVTSDVTGLANRVDVYNWAVAHYFPLCNQTAFSLYDGSIPDHMRNYIISESLFTFWRVLYVHTDLPLEWGQPALDPDPQEELKLFEDFLNSTPSNMVAIGYMWPDGANEGEVMRRISQSNKYLIAADYIENLPFLSRMILPENYTFHQYRPDSYPELENKVYISGIWSDGDNIQYVYNYMKFHLWDGGGGEGHGLIPTGWTINPSLYYMAPYMLKYYYESASVNDYFVGGLSGKGYCKYDYFTNQSFLEQFVSESNDLYDLADITEGRIWLLENTSDYVTRNTHLDGIFDGYGGSPRYAFPRVVNDVPILSSIYVQNDLMPPLNFINNVLYANPGQPQFYFFHLHCWTCNTTIWNDLARQLDGMKNVEVVRPDTLVQLIKQWDGTVPVVNYGVLFNAMILVGLIITGIAFRARKR